ncbi:Sensor protein ZraS [Pontiella desulfatans]|uniref:histidine kinase n=2 Tax=Pontiella desulfatans TaxID=2750659 RepID=A0A6C2U9M3_PONDE|nr:Sensor protein ZraS [Pontiella desulfatans]
MHKILTVSTLLRRFTAYALITVYLSVVYFITASIMRFACEALEISMTFPIHLTSALAVAFSMLPARSRMQKATDLLFGGTNYFNVQDTVRKASDIFQSVTTITSLLDHFSNLLVSAFGTERVIILTATDGGYKQQYPYPLDNAVFFSENSALVGMLERNRDPVCAESLLRIRETSEIHDTIKNLKSSDANIATGVFSKSKLNGIVLFGTRHKGRIYDKTEQDAIQILCNQFAVAFENAQLYTEMQDSKIRNEIMLDQLVSGVIVASPDRKITLFNHEAQRITGIVESEAIGQNIDILPKAIAMALEETLEDKTGLRNIDASLYSPEVREESVSIRMGSAFLFGHDDKPMGALLVFTDTTELKGLEEQVRRSDQLSSVGTLAAGMAHEIKNPLVTIKTFTQLLPKRYDDEDFRQEFSSLVAHEVSRIDGIVNELLSFSKPAKPHLVPMKLQHTIDQILKLTHEQMVQSNIQLKNKCTAENDMIFGDAKLLSQALINLNLNAAEAIGEGGTITVGTLNCTYRFANGDSPEHAKTKHCIRLQITDTGKGIERKDLQKIFDPFFTSKSEGTGMGLSVAHGIINEHHGVIEVESEPGLGTTFYVYIPLLEEGIAS